MPIHLLDKDVISRIAAGEVIERPASVVKELVENALDAGSTQITVEIRGGGVNLIRVTDNGGGIPASEVELAFERHATSKITRLEDLQSLATLGFRGEALPSIAAVAEVELLTGTAGDPAATLVSLDNGVITARRSQGRGRGTTVTVRNLFRSIPARLKFLKSEATESGRIADIVSQYALAFPEVAFTFINEGRTSLHTPGKGSLLEAVIEVYGIETAAQMLEIKSSDWTRRQVQVSGMVGAPSAARARLALSLFVNRRWVGSRLLVRAVEEAYSGLLTVGKHPIAVINVTIPPGEVDVNVHPAKTEIKFRDDAAVFTAVQRAVRRTLVEQATIPRIEEAAMPFRGTPVPERHTGLVSATGSGQEGEPSQLKLQASLPVLRVIGQALLMYIIAEGPDALYIIDQHAAHERVLFEKVRQQHESRAVEAQGLLEPAVINLEPAQEAILGDSLEALAGFGFQMDPFGNRAYLVRSVPALLNGDTWRSMLQELLSTLAGSGKSGIEAAALELIACHGAVRAGQALSQEEMRGLVRDLEQTENPHTCPHGRPTIIQWGAAQIARDFKRT